MRHSNDENTILSVEKLTIQFGTKRVVDDVSFAVGKGKTLCIAGESGSGKSLSSLAIMGLLPELAQIPQGAIIFENTDLLTQPESALRRLRGHDIGMIFQEPMTSLNPLMTIRQQLDENLRQHTQLSSSERLGKIRQMLDAVKMSQADKRLQQYPHELSGGMRQRVMIAMAMLCQPKLLIADEPTTALDVTIQAQILALLDELKREFDTSIIMITHDMGVVAEVADDVVVMNQGRVEEKNSVRSVFLSPKAPYTQKLLEAVPVLGKAPQITAIQSPKPILTVRDLTVRFPVRRDGFFKAKKEVHAVNGVNFDLYCGETLGIVGESGCGKSTTGKALMNMLDYSGDVHLDGLALHNLHGQQLVNVRQDIQMIFQDPYAALNPRKTIFELVGEPLLIHKKMPEELRRELVKELLEKVNLPADAMERYPHQFSGGQRQRICIARALALNPKVIIADESVSALDVSVQAQVLELLEQLREQYNLSYLFISHDMAVIERICHRVAVMYFGQIVEIGPREQVLHHPQHPYTKRLLDAVPMPDVNNRRDFSALLHRELKAPDPIKPMGTPNSEQQFADYGNGHFAAI